MQFISSGNMRALFIACVCVPLFLALISIFSTQLDPTVQSQPIAGIPLFLWLWLGVSVSICTLLMWLGSRLSYQETDFVVKDVVTSPPMQKSVGGENHD